jgi:diguanylate cyclase (GGDEF)-like protein
VAAALQGGLRSYDLCVRYAGDEFIVVLAECSRETAEAKRRDLQQRVSEIEFEVRAGKKIRLAVSAGASVYPADGVTHESLLAAADHSMYRDKAAHRGRITLTRAAGQADFIDAAGFAQTSTRLASPADHPRTIA